MKIKIEWQGENAQSCRTSLYKIEDNIGEKKYPIIISVT